MDLRQIENIIAIEQEQSISRAAEKLFLTQSALNQQLLKLEKELGSANFFRCNKCYLINLRFVTGIEKDDVLLGDKNIPVSRAKKSDLKKALVAYMGEAMK